MSKAVRDRLKELCERLSIEEKSIHRSDRYVADLQQSINYCKQVLEHSPDIAVVNGAYE